MGLLIDTNVFIAAERSGSQLDFDRWAAHGQAYVSVITVSELLVGVLRADTQVRRERRQAFVDAIIAAVPALDITPAVARVHAGMLAALQPGQTVGAHDALIGATAAAHGFAVLTANRRDFDRLAGLQVLSIEA